MLRKLISRPLPEAPPEAPSLRSVAEQALAASPLAAVRTFWNSLREFQDWWPVLIPLLLWIGWRTYQRERARVLAGAGEA